MDGPCSKRRIYQKLGRMSRVQGGNAPGTEYPLRDWFFGQLVLEYQEIPSERTAKRAPIVFTSPVIPVRHPPLLPGSHGRVRGVEFT